MIGPGIEKGKVCNKQVQLLDVYPTLLELTNLKSDSKLEGNSLVPLLKKLNAEWSHYARTSFGPGNYSITPEDYRFIQYKDGSEEFYNHKIDPQEWHNAINNLEYVDVIEKHRAEIPQEHYEILGEGSTGHLSYEASGKRNINNTKYKL
ncbi:sulfatase/phosphatase domain-containing protein [Algibacter miyuki]|uniref:Sulfatase/phosphatase domain-containing protein n=1 Tax=Algibacter miyuki TaxID=1306933 RepID=A0ABV5H4K3_9FLAO|nr:sulfatase/phosphatase domain-containing protein [Algibacter miyuki]MDN3663990.1 hypothetical protein [Algibacter miyuki]